MASIRFVDIDLDDVQREAFMGIVEAFRSAPRGERTLMLVESLAGASLHGPGGQTWTNLDHHDLDVMVGYGLLTVAYGGRGTPNYAVTPGGNRYYEWLRQQQGLPVKQVETAIRDFMDAEWFSERFGAAHAKWSQAVELLWSENAERELSRIGHTVREAMQEFADELAGRAKVSDVPSDKAKTVARIREVFDAKVTSGTTRAFFDALLAYWGTVSDLVQRQEHAGQKEGEPVTWEDARRVVFQSLSVMYEIARGVL